MAIKLFRRHLKDCRDARPRNDFKWTKCGCPIWVRGTLGGGPPIFESMKTANMKLATITKAQAEVRGTWNAVETKTEQTGISVADACTEFLEDAEHGRKLSTTSIKKYKLLLRRLREFAELRSIDRLAMLTTDDIGVFRRSWTTLGVRAAGKHLELLKSFFQFAQERDWIAKNVARPVKGPKSKPKQALPFTAEEERLIYEACETLDMENGYASDADGITNDELLTFVLMLRWTGLRIGDVGLLTTDRVQDGRVLLYTQKTGTHVFTPLPPSLVARMASMRIRLGKYYFIPGHSLALNGVADAWRRKIGRACELAGVVGGNPHRFRHTFAVDLLSKGTSLESVSILLGHGSLKTTQQYYSAWSHDRQKHLEEQVAKTWGADILQRPANVIPFQKKVSK